MLTEEPQSVHTIRYNRISLLLFCKIIRCSPTPLLDFVHTVFTKKGPFFWGVVGIQLSLGKHRCTPTAVCVGSQEQTTTCCTKQFTSRGSRRSLLCKASQKSCESIYDGLSFSEAALRRLIVVDRIGKQIERGPYPQPTEAERQGGGAYPPVYDEATHESTQRQVVRQPHGINSFCRRRSCLLDLRFACLVEICYAAPLALSV